MIVVEVTVVGDPNEVVVLALVEVELLIVDVVETDVLVVEDVDVLVCEAEKYAVRVVPCVTVSVMTGFVLPSFQ